jgi:orotate phosphoribosyltransferase
MEQEIAETLLKIKAVKLRPKNPFTWASGIKSPIYCDNRIWLSFPEERKLVINGFVKKIEEIGLENIDVIGGVATSGIPFAAFVAAELNKPMIYIRKKSKEYGQENRIEGRLEKGKRVVVIEDLISTGGSTFSCVDAVRNQDGIVDHCIAIFSYGFPQSENGAAERNVQLQTLSNFSTLVNVAVDQKYITGENKDAVLAWAENPKEWGTQQGFE